MWRMCAGVFIVNSDWQCIVCLYATCGFLGPPQLSACHRSSAQLPALPSIPFLPLLPPDHPILFYPPHIASVSIFTNSLSSVPFPLLNSLRIVRFQRYFSDTPLTQPLPHLLHDHFPILFLKTRVLLLPVLSFPPSWSSYSHYTHTPTFTPTPPIYQTLIYTLTPPHMPILLHIH